MFMLRVQREGESKFRGVNLPAGDSWVTISFCNFPLNYLYYISLAENSKTFSID